MVIQLGYLLIVVFSTMLIWTYVERFLSVPLGYDYIKQLFIIHKTQTVLRQLY